MLQQHGETMAAENGPENSSIQKIREHTMMCHVVSPNGSENGEENMWRLVAMQPFSSHYHLESSAETWWEPTQAAKTNFQDQKVHSGCNEKPLRPNLLPE